MSSKPKTLKNIVISEKTYEELKLLGRTGDSFNDVISRLVRNKNGGAVSD
jgi:predicted CopG family antitoxin